jgi:hypothetical protein
MPELGASGSVRGALRNERPYRERARSLRHITLPCSDLALPLQRERNRSQQAMIAWQQRTGASGTPSRPQAGGAGRAQREP